MLKLFYLSVAHIIVLIILDVKSITFIFNSCLMCKIFELYGCQKFIIITVHINCDLELNCFYNFSDILQHPTLKKSEMQITKMYITYQN